MRDNDRTYKKKIAARNEKFGDMESSLGFAGINLNATQRTEFSQRKPASYMVSGKQGAQDTS